MKSYWRRFNWKRQFFFLLVVGAVFFRIAVISVPGNALNTPWSAGNDTQGYILLAHNLAAGSGFTYAGVPSAFRAPGYPFLLAGLLQLFGPHFIVVARWVQFLAGIGVAYFCWRIAGILFNEETAKLALLVSLMFPTLIFFTSEILTESFAALFVTIFCWLLARDAVRPTLQNLVGMGFAVGCGALLRPNVVLLATAGLIGTLLVRQSPRECVQVAILPLVVMLVLSPWVLRNRFTFGGDVLLSTQGGLNALVGVIDPEGRSQPGETERIRAAMGFVPPQDLETNSASRLALGSEPEMNRRAWRRALLGWSQMRWHTISWIAKKWECFWLSTEQIFTNSALPTWKRTMRISGVIFYWLLLALAAGGLRHLRQANNIQARAFLIYAAVITILHTPFVMNTRIRAPLLDPFLAVLASGGLLAFSESYKAKTRISFISR